MGRKNLVIIFSVCIFFSSCKNYYINNEGGNRPKKNRFTLNTPPYILKSNDLINTTSVYVNTSEIVYGGKKHIDYHYIRFFNDGKYLEDLVSNKEELTISNFNNVNNALMVGYYNIQQKKYIQLEYFRVKYGEGGFYDIREGYIKNDSIFMFYSEYNNNNYPIPNSTNCRIYIKQEIEGLEGVPDW